MHWNLRNKNQLALYVSVVCVEETCLRMTMYIRNVVRRLTFWHRNYYFILAHPVYKM